MQPIFRGEPEDSNALNASRKAVSARYRPLNHSAQLEQEEQQEEQQEQQEQQEEEEEEEEQEEEQEKQEEEEQEQQQENKQDEQRRSTSSTLPVHVVPSVTGEHRAGRTGTGGCVSPWRELTHPRH